MLNPWFFLAILAMAVNWAAVWFGWKTANFISKPAIISALLGWFFSTAGFSTPALWFGIGLGCALAGDTLLLFKRKGFLPGVAAFMLMHSAYIIGFNQAPQRITPAIAALILASFSLWAWLFASLRPKAVANPA